MEKQIPWSFVKQIAQKNIKIFCDRIINADSLFEVDSYSISLDSKNILLIDDVFGS